MRPRIVIRDEVKTPDGQRLRACGTSIGGKRGDEPPIYWTLMSDKQFQEYRLTGKSPWPRLKEYAADHTWLTQGIAIITCHAHAMPMHFGTRGNATRSGYAKFLRAHRRCGVIR